MSTTRSLEDTLPTTAPATNQDTSKLMGKKYAIYTTLDLSMEDLESAQHALNNNSETLGEGNCHPAPRPSFPGKTIRHIYEHHINTRDGGELRGYWHPLFFIVIDRRDWATEGVLFVNLKIINRRGENVIGVCRCAANMANSIAANLETGNMDWMDFKEWEAEEWGGENAYGNPRYFPGREEGLANPGLWKFAWYSAVEKSIGTDQMLEPNWLDLQRGESRFWFRGIAGDDMLRIRREHPFTCLVDPQIHRQLILVAEKENANEQEGMALCRLEWEGDLTGFSYDGSTYEGQNRDRAKVQAIMPEIKVLERVRAGEALTRLDMYAADC